MIKLACLSELTFSPNDLISSCVLKEQLILGSEEGEGEIGILFETVVIGKDKSQLGRMSKDFQNVGDQPQIEHQKCWPSLEPDSRLGINKVSLVEGQRASERKSLRRG